MTELRGRTARWSAAALAAPVVASLFAGTTAWALHHDPLHPAGAQPASQPAPVAASPTPDPTLVALRTALLTNAKKVDALSRQVAAVRAQAAALAQGTASKARAGSSGGSSYTSRSSGGSSASTRSGGGSSAPIVVTLPAIPAAPAPATHGATGASGAVK